MGLSADVEGVCVTQQKIRFWFDQGNNGISAFFCNAKVSSIALMDFGKFLSDLRRALRDIQPSSLGGFSENSVSANSNANSLEMALDASVEMPQVIQPEIISDIVWGITSGC
ncbi:hypothetical protein OUZ56_012880 [Daphnia magna]|uniref:Uncharacterized protein n=1 Tax=Daphnia magna TaxID=35525 RepID=A0ABQ9Z4B1_9CRUS|nr:hypothetical protein OUZ56_012880 [Daphnia magna]